MATGMRRKGASSPEKFGEWSLSVWKPCNPLKSHNIAKAFFGNVWSKTFEFWKSLEKSLGARLDSAASAPSRGAAVLVSDRSPASSAAEPFGGTERLGY